MKKFNYKSVMEIPHIDKIVINTGIGEAISNPKVLGGAAAELAQIIGQALVITKAKKSITDFKLRGEMSIGCKVILRKEKMYDFMNRLMNISLPRVRGFRGANATSSGDRGNYTLGVKEQLIFSEIDYDKINKVHGMGIVTVTTANANEETRALLEEMGVPSKR